MVKINTWDYSTVPKRLQRHTMTQDLEFEVQRLKAEVERLEDLLSSVYETTLEQDTKSRIANNLDGSPNGYKFRRDRLNALCEKLASVTEMFVGYCTDDFAPTPMKMAREILAEYRSYKNEPAV